MNSKIYEVETLYGPLDVRPYMGISAAILGLGIYLIVNALLGIEMETFGITGLVLLFLGGSMLYDMCDTYRCINLPGSIERQLAGE